MLQQLRQVFESDESEEIMSDVVRRFWTRAKPLPPRVAPRSSPGPEAQVVDLAAWSLARRPAR